MAVRTSQVASRADSAAKPSTLVSDRALLFTKHAESLSWRSRNTPLVVHPSYAGSQATSNMHPSYAGSQATSNMHPKMAPGTPLEWPLIGTYYSVRWGVYKHCITQK